jgi:hypothetical protein
VASKRKDQLAQEVQARIWTVGVSDHGGRSEGIRVCGADGVDMSMLSFIG